MKNINEIKLFVFLSSLRSFYHLRIAVVDDEKYHSFLRKCHDEQFKELSILFSIFTFNFHLHLM